MKKTPPLKPEPRRISRVDTPDAYSEKKIIKNDKFWSFISSTLMKIAKSLHFKEISKR